jgi:hypothetical protein
MKFSLAIVLLAAAGVRAADPVALDIKPGEWEATVTSQITGLSQGAPQIPADQLAKMPPEQRAKVEAMLKQMGGPRTSTNKSCVKKEDLTKLQVNNDQSCKTTLVSSSGTKQEIHMECDRKGGKQTGTITIETLSSESIKFNIQAGGDSNGKNISMTVNGASKWLGPVCEDTK